MATKGKNCTKSRSQNLTSLYLPLVAAFQKTGSRRHAPQRADHTRPRVWFPAPPPETVHSDFGCVLLARGHNCGSSAFTTTERPPISHQVALFSKFVHLPEHFPFESTKMEKDDGLCQTTL